MHRKDQVFIRPLGWSKVLYEAPFRQKRGSKFGHFRQFSQISREPNVLAKRAGCQKNRLKKFFLVKIVLQPGEPPDRFFCLCTRSFRQIDRQKLGRRSIDRGQIEDRQTGNRQIDRQKIDIQIDRSRRVHRNFPRGGTKILN